MKALKYLAIVLAGFFLFIACKKELSFERGVPLTPAKGSLKDSFGNCMPVVTNGKYVKNAALADSNYIVVKVNFSSPGSYSISTDTSNGFSFHSSGIMADSGLQTITLKGTGTPAAVQVTNFLVAFDSSICTFSINVLDSAIIPPTTSNDYFPTTDSSNWTYKLNSGQSDTPRVTVADADTTIEGNIYKSFVANREGYGSYYRKGGGLYYEYSDLNNFSFYGTVNNKVDYIFLKDNVPVGDTWESPEVDATLSSVPGKAKIKFTIVGKDIQTTVGTTTFDSVIQVKREYMFAPSAGTYSGGFTANFYYAKNIGFIKAEGSDAGSLITYVMRWQIFY